MGVDAAKTGQASGSNTLGDNARYKNLVVIADQDAGDLAFPIN
jgi:hypothetical protein